MKIHFVGCMGSSMRFLMRMAKANGADVSGSDLTTTGHREDFAAFSDLVVYSGAIKQNNPELVFARRNNIPVLERAEFLGELASNFNRTVSVAGTHGKTTTTGLVFEAVKELNPTLHIGGEYNGEYGHIGGKDVFITEACEYRRSFLSLKSEIGIITNIELDHTDYYKDLTDMFSAFSSFALNSKKLIVCGEEPLLYNLEHSNKITYGLTSACDFYAHDIEYNGKQTEFSVYKKGKFLRKFTVNLSGEHNVLNALAAITAALIMGVSADKIADSIKNFKGVNRRFQFMGRVNNADVISDYAHHPSEIKATVSAAKKMGYKKIGVVFEPHTYSRLKSFKNGFVEALELADDIIVTRVFAAREEPLEGVTGESLAEEIKKGAREVFYADAYSEVISLIKSSKFDCDIWLILGAGTIEEVAKKLC